MSETIDAGASGGLPEAPTLEELGGGSEGSPPEQQPQSREGEGEPAQPQEGQPPQPPRMVPLPALQEARAETKREREERIKLEARFNEFRETITRQMQGQQQPQKPAEPEIPDINADPVGHFRAKYEALERQVQQVQQPVQQQQQHAAFVSHVKGQVNEFAARTPDYDAAYAFAQQKWREDAEAYGDDASQAEILIAQRALKQGRNVGEAVYEFARKKGYQPGGQQAQQQQAPQPPDMGAVQRGQAVARSVGSNGTPAGKTDMSGQRVLSMPLNELKSMSDADWKAALGGG